MASTSTSDDASLEDDCSSAQKASIIQTVEICSKRLFEIWADIGFSSEEKNLRCKKFNEQIQLLVEGENKLRQKLIKAIEDQVKQISLLCEELGLGKCVDMQEFQASEEMPLMMVNSDMKRRIKALTDQKAERLQELHALLENDQKISQELGTAPYYFDAKKLPTESQLKEIRTHIEDLGAEKSIRKKKLQDGCATISQLMRELECVPKTAFEKDVVTGKGTGIPLYSDNMHRLRQLQEKLEAKVKENECVGRELRKRLYHLWERLSVEQPFQDDFMDGNPGSQPSTLKTLKCEVARCEELKMQNIKKFVEQARMDLANLWDRCFYNHEQRVLFRPFEDDHFTEELLDAHEREVNRLREFATSAENILTKIALWDELFQKMLEFERKGYDTNRLANRGGQLLQEEKERKTIMIRLPKLEKDLHKITAEWEQENQRPIIVYGKRIVDYIGDQWAQFNTDKENEKQLRQQAKAQQLQQDMLGFSKITTPAKKRPLGTPGRSNNVNKRSRLGDPGCSALMSPAVHGNSFARRPPLPRNLAGRRPITRHQTKKVVLRERPVVNNQPNSSVANSTMSVAESEFVFQNALTEQRKVGPLNSTAVDSVLQLGTTGDRAGVETVGDKDFKGPVLY